jgi:hypothetical protein
MMIEVHITHKNALEKNMKFEVKRIHYFQS